MVLTHVELYFHFFVIGSIVPSSRGFKSIQGMSLSPKSSPFSVRPITWARTPAYFPRYIRTQVHDVSVISCFSTSRSFLQWVPAEFHDLDTPQRVPHTLVELVWHFELDHTGQWIALKRRENAERLQEFNINSLSHETEDNFMFPPRLIDNVLMTYNWKIK